MHTKPISTEVIAAYEATLTSGFAIPTPPIETKGIDLSEFRQKMVNGLNDSESFEWSLAMFDTLTDNVKQWPLSNEKEDDATDLHEAYRSICDSFCSRTREGIEEETIQEVPKESHTELRKYFRNFNQDEATVEYVDVPSLISKIGLDSSKKMTLSKGCAMLAKYVQDDSPMQSKALPFLFIIHSTLRRCQAPLVYNIQKVIDLFARDLAAAKLFYRTLNHDANRDPSNLTLIRAISKVLDSFSSQTENTVDMLKKSRLKGRPIFEQFYSFHLEQKSFRATSACIRLFSNDRSSQEDEEDYQEDVRQEDVRQVQELLDFCDAFKEFESSQYEHPFGNKDYTFEQHPFDHDLAVARQQKLGLRRQLVERVRRFLDALER